MTSLKRGSWALVFAVLGCGNVDPSVPAADEVPATPPVMETPAAPAPGPASRAYDPASRLFVVHEWGTFTNVAGSDGSIQPGLHHEEEDLPGFVADRLAQAMVTPAIVQDLARQKLETPVTYFYSPSPRQVSVQANFPRGIFTQWYPYVRDTLPRLYIPVGERDVVDPWISTSTSIPPRCLANQRITGDFNSGLLDWGTVDVLSRDASVAVPGALGKTNWHLARNTASNPVRVSIGGTNYEEKFLFYRGLGNFSMRLGTRVGAGGMVTLTNHDHNQAMPASFLVNVTRDGAAFKALGAVPAGSDLSATLPDPVQPLDRYTAELKNALAAGLVADGLYTDEAQAMVDTWERSYFLTPGPRVLYLLPHTTADEILPLKISPPPSKVVRTMVIRVELITPEQEARLATALHALAAPPPSMEHQLARDFIFSLGRFAEPHLTRALGLATDPTEIAAGQELLTEVRQHRRWAPLAAE